MNCENNGGEDGALDPVAATPVPFISAPPMPVELTMKAVFVDVSLATTFWEVTDMVPETLESSPSIVIVKVGVTVIWDVM